MAPTSGWNPVFIDTHALTGVVLKTIASGFARPTSSMLGTALIPALTERGVPVGLNSVCECILLV